MEFGFAVLAQNPYCLQNERSLVKVCFAALAKLSPIVSPFAKGECVKPAGCEKQRALFCIISFVFRALWRKLQLDTIFVLRRF